MHSRGDLARSLHDAKLVIWCQPRLLSLVGVRSLYVSVTCVIMQRVGAGLHMASTCLWNRKTDGSCHVRWENGTVVCVVTVFGLAI